MLILSLYPRVDGWMDGWMNDGGEGYITFRSTETEERAYARTAHQIRLG